MTRASVLALAVLTSVALIVIGAFGDVKPESVWLSVPPLVVAFATLYYVVPSPSRVAVVRQDDLELNGLIFHIYEEGGSKVPRDYLLQIHLAVANVGGRKAVVSRLELDSFRDGDNAILRLPEAPHTVKGTEYHARTGYRNGKYYFENESLGGPWLLGPGDVITLRARARRGIDWSNSWDLDRLKGWHDALVCNVVAATGTVAWREGKRVHEQRFEVRVHTAQQHEYVAALRNLTDNFSTLPNVTPRTVHIE